MESNDQFLAVLAKFYPDLFKEDKTFKLNNNELMEFIKNNFHSKFNEDIEDLLNSHEIKFAD